VFKLFISHAPASHPRCNISLSLLDESSSAPSLLFQEFQPLKHPLAICESHLITDVVRKSEIVGRRADGVLSLLQFGKRWLDKKKEAITLQTGKHVNGFTHNKIFWVDLVYTTG